MIDFSVYKDPLLDHIQHEVETGPYITITGQNENTLKLTASELKFDCTVIFKNVFTEASITSSGYVVLTDCPRMGDITTPKYIIAKNCGPLGFVKAKSILRFDGRNFNVYRNTKFHDGLTVSHPCFYLIDSCIKGRIVFLDLQGKQISGKIFMDPDSIIEDSQGTDVEIVILPTEEIEKLIKVDKDLDSKRETTKPTTPAEEPAPAAPHQRETTQATAKKTQATSQEALPK